ncbi:arylsulfatase [Thalassoglobus sp. JC818]|uniref:arylsulfatase n=1 Tax=Thalassoglobus sp. JC818 TaxID=3232136 RepID=UPI0034591172
MKLAVCTAVVFFTLFGTECLHAADSRPNILVMMVDDLGYSDLGCYGSEIDTPNLDALAANGLRFSQFYNTAKCHSSRVSLLTGQYCIAAGDTALTHAVTSAEVLADSGYFTAMTGKWHLDGQPTDFGFQKYFGHLSGACNYFTGDNTFRLNGEKWQVPKEGFYTTTANVDYALEFLGEARQTKSPWFLYVAFNAPHAPLHALPEDYAKYKGRYDEGWDKVRAARVAKQKQIGILPATLKESPRPDHILAWEDMEPWRQKYEANRMTTLAAMIDRVDQEIGRLVTDLRSRGELENTLILFVSDNGACPYDRKKPLLDVEPTTGDISLADSTGWSWMRNSPFRYYKQNQFEGGISTPGIVHWPAGLKTSPGSVVDTPVHLIDVMPTLADVAGAEVPETWPARELRPVSGISLLPLFEGNEIERPSPIHLLFSKDRGLRDGDWKIVSFQSSPWELYHVADDRAELHNLAHSEPERVQQMVETWTNMARGVLHAKPNVYAPVDKKTEPHRHREWTNFDSDAPSKGQQVMRRRSQNRGKPNKPIRARKNTRLTLEDGTLQLQFTGEDPGIAMDLRGHDLPNGPYRLTFKLRDGSRDGGELFFTTDSERTLPKGERLTFPVVADGEWQSISLDLATKSRIYQLRIDVSSGPGKATISELQLGDEQGQLLMSWPEKESN